MKLNLPNTPKTIGLLLSGGVESTLLLYLLSLQYPEQSIKSFVIIKPQRVSLRCVKNVLQWIEERTGKKSEYIPIFPMLTWSSQQVLAGWGMTIIRSDEVDVLLTGGNPYPRHIYPDMPEREYMGCQGRILHPFNQSFKTEIFEMYRKYDALHLLKLTHSCFDNMETHCGKCVNCRERLWAHENTNIPFEVNYAMAT